jgi:hypothetical protein
MSEHIGWQNESGGTFNDLMKIITSLPEKDSNILREFIKRYDIKSPKELLLFPTTTYLQTKHAGKSFLLNLKLSLYENGFPYDLDTPTYINQKIIDCQIRNEANKKMRFEILKRDNFTCRYCGRSPRANQNVILEIDHIHPQSKGGVYEKENLITSCHDCNGGKSDILLTRL